MVARTRGTSYEHRLRGEETFCFQHAVCSFLPPKLGGAFAVGRKRRLQTKSGCQICLEHPVGCCLGRIDSGGGW